MARRVQATAHDPIEPPHPSPAWEVLRAVALDHPTPEVRGDSDAIRVEAWKHGLAGLVGARVRAGTLVLPPQVAERVLAEWAWLKRYGLILELELERLAKDAAGLHPPIVLKGPAVAQVYADPSVRIGSDLDILVPAAEQDRWHALLARAGYRPTRHDSFDRRFLHAVPYVREAGPGLRLEVDLHTKLWVEPSVARLRYEELRRFSIASGAHAGHTLHPAAMLLQLCVHLVHHAPAERRLIWFRDLVEMSGWWDDARALADDLGVAWVVDAARLGLEALETGMPVIDGGDWARLVRDPTRPMAHHVSRLRAFGWHRAPMYVATLLDPRRYRSGDRVSLRTYLTTLRQAMRGGIRARRRDR